MSPEHAGLRARQREAPHALQVSLTKVAGKKESLEWTRWGSLRGMCVRVNIQVSCDILKVSTCKSLPLLAVPSQ